MRSPSRRRPRRGARLSETAQVDLAALARRVSYVISTEHKDYKTSAGPGRLRSDATPCPRELDLGDVLRWLRESVCARNVSADFDGDFPRYVWATSPGMSGRVSSVGSTRRA